MAFDPSHPFGGPGPVGEGPVGPRRVVGGDGRQEPAIRYFYCERSGFRVPYGALVPDGEIEGLYVARGWEDPMHPQRYAPIISGGEGFRDRPAPPQDEQDTTDAVTLTFDGVEYEV